MQKVNLEEILNNNCPYGHKWSEFLLPDQVEFMKKAMKEACRQVLELAAENAIIGELYDEEANLSYPIGKHVQINEIDTLCVHKDSILNTINQVE